MPNIENGRHFHASTTTGRRRNIVFLASLFVRSLVTKLANTLFSKQISRIFMQIGTSGPRAWEGH